MAKPKLMLSEIDVFILVGIAITGLIIGGSIYLGLSLTQQKSANLPAMSNFSGPKMRIQSVSGNVTVGTITVVAQSTGEYSPIVLVNAVIKDYRGDPIEVVDATNIDDNDADTPTDVPAVDSKRTTLVIKVKNGTLEAGASYTVTLASTGGFSFVSTFFKAEA